MKTLPLLHVCFWAAWISACASSTGLPEAAGSVRDLYRQSIPSDASAPTSRPLPDGTDGGNPFLESANRQLHRDFEVLPNPRLILYVYPHFSVDGSPVPGYATWFDVFEQGPILKIAR